MLSGGVGKKLLGNEKLAVFADTCQFADAGNTGSAQLCQVGEVVKNMGPGDLLRAINRNIVLRKPPQELQQISAVGHCRVSAQVSPAQAVEIPGE